MIMQAKAHHIDAGRVRGEKARMSAMSANTATNTKEPQKEPTTRRDYQN
jgi:hypothetical protein